MPEETTATKKKKKPKGDLTLDLEQFYADMEEEEKLEKLEDIRRLAEESKRLLTKVDRLVELLLRAAEEEGEEEELEKILEVVEELQALKEELTKVEELKNVLDGIAETQKDILEKLTEAQTRISESIDTHFLNLSEDLDRVKEVRAVLDEIREYIKRQAEEREWVERELALIEREVQTLSATLEAFRKLVGGDIEEKKKALENIRKRLEDVSQKLVHLRTLGEKGGEKLGNLEENLRKAFQEVKAMIERLTEEEQREIGMLKAQLEDVRAILDALQRRLEKGPEKEEILALRNILANVEERLHVLTERVSRNGEAAKLLSGDLAEVLYRTHVLSEQIAKLEELSERQITFLTRLEDVYRELDKKLIALSEALEKIGRRIDELRIPELEDVKKELSILHADMASVLDALRRFDVLDVLSEIKELLEDRGKDIEHIEALLEEIDKRIPEERIKEVEERFADVLSKLKEANEKLERVGAVLTPEDLRQILHDVEELRAKVRMLRDAGLLEELEKLLEKLNVPESAALVETPETEETVEHAEIVADVAREGRKQIAAIKRKLPKRGTKARIVLKRVERIERTLKAMERLEKLAKKVDAETEALKKKAKKKRLNVPTPKDEDVVLPLASKLVPRLRKLRKGERKSVSELAKEVGAREELVLKALKILEHNWEHGIKVVRPFFLGKPYVVRR